MYVLFPGRHHALTRFQFEALRGIVDGEVLDLDGVALTGSASVLGVITSANHSNTRRNPVPLALRSAQLHLAAADAGLGLLTAPVDDVGHTERFAGHVIAAIAAEESVCAPDGSPLELDPSNAVVASSTPSVASQFAALGFRVFGLELSADQLGPGDSLAEKLAAVDDATFVARRPWELVEAVGAGADLDDPAFGSHAHPATTRVWRHQGLAHRVASVFADPLAGDDSDLTTNRNYFTYMASFDRGAERKWALLEPHVRSGRIVDIGCATGAVLAEAGRTERLAESDLFGIELSRALYDECQHRRRMGAFENENTFFHHRNALDDLFEPASVDTTMTVSLTHEILSYADTDALLRLCRAIRRQTARGGVWLNYDVCAPAEPDRIVRLELSDDDGASVRETDPGSWEALEGDDLKRRLDQLSTRARFEVFAATFRADEGDGFGAAGPLRRLADGSIELRLGDAMDFLAHRTYTDSWRSEMHERFCWLDLAGWTALLGEVGFAVDPASRSWTNPWLAEHRFDPVARLTLNGRPLSWGETNCLIVARPD